MPSKMKVYLTEKEAAAFTNFKAGTLRNMRSEKRGPQYLKIGRTVRYRLHDIESWLNRQAVLTKESGTDG